MKGSKKIYYVSITSAAFCGLLITILGSCISVKKEQGGVSVIRNSAETDIYSAVTEIPLFDGKEELNKDILQISDTWFKQFYGEAQANTEARIETAVQGEHIETPFCTFDQTWKLVQNSSDYISCLLKSYSYTGGANGITQIASFTWDVKNNKAVSLDTLLAEFKKPADLVQLAEICRKQLIQRLKAQDDPNLMEMIQDGTAPISDNYRVFTLSDQNLTIYFGKYQVAPGSYGIQEVSIPRIK